MHLMHIVYSTTLLDEEDLGNVVADRNEWRWGGTASHESTHSMEQMDNQKLNLYATEENYKAKNELGNFDRRHPILASVNHSREIHTIKEKVKLYIAQWLQIGRMVRHW